MADHIEVTPGTGATIAADEISGVLYQRVKLIHGADGTNDGDVAGGNPLPVVQTGSLPAGTNAIGKLAANSGVDIGDVDVTSCALPTGASTSAKQDTIIGHIDGVEALLTTIDGDTSGLAGCVAGTEVQVDVLSSALPTGAATAAKQDTLIGHVDGVETLLGTIDADTSALAGCVGGTEVQVDIVASLPAGTNAIGKLSANSGVDIGDVDVTSCALPTGASTSAKQDDIITDTTACKTSLAIIDDWDDSDKCKVSDAGGSLTVDNGGTFAVQPAVSGTKVQGKVDNADTTTAREVIAASASNYVYITSFVISVAVAGSYWLEDGDATQITPKFYLAANGGVSWASDGMTPYRTNTVNKAVNVKGSTAGAVGVMITGYLAA